MLSLALCMLGSIYAPTLKKWRGHIAPSVYGLSVRLLKKKKGVLNFHRNIPHQKVTDPFF